MSGIDSPCGSLNGSSVEVPEVIIVDTANKTNADGEKDEVIGNTKM